MLPTLVRRRRSLEEPTNMMERFFDRFMSPWWSEAPAEGEYVGAYPVDIREEDGKLIVDAEMPGFQRDEIDVNIDKDILRIRAERTPGKAEGTEHLKERRYTRVERAFTLPTSVDESKVDAKLEDGVLHLEMPETEGSKPRRIEVK